MPNDDELIEQWERDLRRAESMQRIRDGLTILALACGIALFWGLLLAGVFSMLT